MKLHPRTTLSFLAFLCIFQCSLAQITESSYSQDPDEDLHQNQIPPPQYQPSEEDVKTALLDLIKDRIDKDSDSKLTTEELRDWLEVVHHKIIEDSVERQWKYYQPMVQEVHSWEGYAPEMKEVLNWENFRAMTYPDEYLQDSNPHHENMRKLLARSHRRYKLADKNTDTVLTIEEFKDFIHPEEAKGEIQSVLVDEAVEDMDTDKDSKITMEEYLKHLYSVSDETERDDPQWKPVRILLATSNVFVCV
jgi:Ca2+-binding EF-hand superfamily protein